MLRGQRLLAEQVILSFLFNRQIDGRATYINDAGHRTPSMGWLKQKPKVTCSSDTGHESEVRCAGCSIGGQEIPG